jgi:hypothetical protein
MCYGYNTFSLSSISSLPLASPPNSPWLSNGRSLGCELSNSPTPGPSLKQRFEGFSVEPRTRVAELYKWRRHPLPSLNDFWTTSQALHTRSHDSLSSKQFHTFDEHSQSFLEVFRRFSYGPVDLH